MKHLCAAFFLGVLLVTNALAGDYSQLHLRRFFSPGSGLVLFAPDSWEDTSSAQHFQIYDRPNDTSFTSTGYANPGATVQQFASMRLSAVDQKMPYLRQTKAPYQIKGKTWVGIAAEYTGTFPGEASSFFRVTRK
jgi:hypothetical protein